MKFKPLLATDLSGHLGGIVASHNTYGPYFRQRVRPINPRTDPQQAQRAAVAATSQTWRILDPLVQDSWKAAHVTKTSKSGDVVILAGQAAWMFVNTLRKRAALIPIAAPPCIGDVPELTLPTITMTSATRVTIAFAADPWNLPGGIIIVSGALITSTGRSYAAPNRAVAIFDNPGIAPLNLDLPFAVPIGGTIRMQFHATSPTGGFSTYRTVDTRNTSFPPPPPSPLHVLEVTLVGTKKYLWRFDGPITLTPGADANLTIAGDTSGVAAADGTHGTIVTYSTAATTPLAWIIPAQPTSISEAIAIPQSGLTD